MDDKKSLILGLIEADKIQGYIFRTGKLIENIGASTLIDEYNKQVAYEVLLNSGKHGNVKKSDDHYKLVEHRKDLIKDNLDYQLIYSGGGNIKILFKDPKLAENLLKQIALAYREQTLSADATWVVEPFTEAEKFNEVIRRGEMKVREKKLSKNFTPAPLTAPYFKLCESCGAEPATDSEYQNFLCSTCLVKRKKGREREIFKDFNTELWSKIGSYFSSQIVTEIKKEAKFDGEDILPRDFEHIADSRNFIAVMVIDGNHFGKTIEQLMKTLQENRKTLTEITEKLSQFSHEVDRLAMDSLAEAVHIAFKEELQNLSNKNIRDKFIKEVVTERSIKEKRFLIPFRPIIIGGDDLTFVCSADKAIAIVRDFAQVLNEESRKQPNLFGAHGLTCGIGLAIVKRNFPFRSTHKLAEELLLSAKRKCRQYSSRQDNPLEVSAIDFCVVTTSSVDSLSSKRKRECLYEMEGSKHLITGRPYIISNGMPLSNDESREDFDKFREQAKKLHECLASNKFRELRKVMRRGESNSHYELAKISYHLRKPEKRKRLMDVINFYGGLWRNGTFEGQDAKINNFSDMVEIFDYIP